MKIKTLFRWVRHYDWYVFPSIMVGSRNSSELTIYNSAFGIGFVWLKIKCEILFYF